MYHCMLCCTRALPPHGQEVKPCWTKRNQEQAAYPPINKCPFSPAAALSQRQSSTSSFLPPHLLQSLSHISCNAGQLAPLKEAPCSRKHPLPSLQARSALSEGERQALLDKEVSGMQHLIRLAARPDFRKAMLLDRGLTHPDLLRPCAAAAQLPLEKPPVTEEDQQAVQAAVQLRAVAQAAGSNIAAARSLSRQLSRVRSQGQDSLYSALQRSLSGWEVGQAAMPANQLHEVAVQLVTAS